MFLIAGFVILVSGYLGFAARREGQSLEHASLLAALSAAVLQAIVSGGARTSVASGQEAQIGLMARLSRSCTAIQTRRMHPKARLITRVSQAWRSSEPRYRAPTRMRRPEMPQQHDAGSPRRGCSGRGFCSPVWYRSSAEPRRRLA
jgi:hypothetical protein